MGNNNDEESEMSLTPLILFLFMVGVMAVGTGTAKDVLPCPVDTAPIQIMTPGHSDDRIVSAAEIPESLPHFRAFVTAVTEHVAARLAKNDLCINSAENVENMRSAARENRSLLQFVRWPLFMNGEYLVPAMISFGGRAPPSCRISSPWIDLVVDRKPVPSIRGIVRWNERQLLADQAVLAGAKNVPLGVAMPLSSGDRGHFIGEYERTEIGTIMRPAPKPIEERVPPDILWLLRRSWQSTLSPFIGSVRYAMDNATKKGAEGYTKLVLTLIDRCFASDGVSFRYNSILDAADLIPLEQYKIDTPIR
jgi:hypothetical protein